ncbi:helix-turn-helix domain-containing protein, partial [Phocaeicola dorei]
MDALFQTQSNELSTITQKEKLFKDAERQWNTLSSEKGAPGRKVDFEIYKSILYNLEIRKVYLDSKLSLEKFSSIVGTNTTYLSNAVNNYFGCNFKRLINSYRVARAKELLDGKDCPV